MNERPDLGEPISGGQQDAPTARAEALRRASLAAAALSGTIGARRARLQALAALLRDLDRRAMSEGPDGDILGHDGDPSDA